MTICSVAFMNLGSPFCGRLSFSPGTSGAPGVADQTRQEYHLYPVELILFLHHCGYFCASFNLVSNYWWLREVFLFALLCFTLVEDFNPFFIPVRFWIDFSCRLDVHCLTAKLIRGFDGFPNRPSTSGNFSLLFQKWIVYNSQLVRGLPGDFFWQFCPCMYTCGVTVSADI